MTPIITLAPLEAGTAPQGWQQWQLGSPEDASPRKPGWHAAAQPLITIGSLNFHHFFYHTLQTALSWRIVDLTILLTDQTTRQQVLTDILISCLAIISDNKGDVMLCENASSNPQMRRYLLFHHDCRSFFSFVSQNLPQWIQMLKLLSTFGHVIKTESLQVSL